VATSTSARRTWRRAGQKLHHLIDPATGRPSDSGAVAATAVAGEAWWAEALAKAAFVAGPEEGPGVLAEGMATGFVVDGAGRVREAPGFTSLRAA
jgi:thiamine biosynthesis lipoprotein